MDFQKKRKLTAWALLAVTAALLAVTVGLILDHRPPMHRMGPPPGDGPEMFGDFPGGPPPDEFFDDEPFGKPHEEPFLMKPEARMVLLSVLVVLMTLCVVMAVRLMKKPRAIPAVLPEEPSGISFKTDYKTVTVALDDIRYIESMSEYVKIHLESQPDPLVVLYSLKRLVNQLPSSRFMRIHRSYIVALDRIREASATTVVLDGSVSLPVGESYRPAFRQYLARK